MKLSKKQIINYLIDCVGYTMTDILDYSDNNITYNSLTNLLSEQPQALEACKAFNN